MYEQSVSHDYQTDSSLTKHYKMDDDDEILILAAAAVPLVLEIINKAKKKRRRRRALWSQKWLRRREEGHGVINMLENELRVEDPESYKMFLRMCGEHFDELLAMVVNDISRQHTNMRQCVTAAQRLAITLRFLATGETYRSLMFASRIHESTISIFIPQVCKSIYKNLKDKYLKVPRNVDEWKQIAEEFETLWNFPLCLGALDGKHINFRAPRSAGSFYYNYKGNHSIVLLALADANCKFIYINVGVNGRISDGGVYRESTLKEAIDSNTIPFPPDVCLPGTNVPVPYTFVADDAFPLSKRIMKPYSQRGLTNEKRIYNYRLSRARRVVENSFGILSNRFRILLTTINLVPEKVEDITLACCALHNFLTTKNARRYADVGENVSKLGRLNQCQSGNRSTETALTIRDTFCEYFNTNGAVPWQNNCLH